MYQLCSLGHAPTLDVHPQHASRMNFGSFGSARRLHLNLKTHFDVVKTSKLLLLGKGLFKFVCLLHEFLSHLPFVEIRLRLNKDLGQWIRSKG